MRVDDFDEIEADLRELEVRLTRAEDMWEVHGIEPTLEERLVFLADLMGIAVNLERN